MNYDVPSYNPYAVVEDLPDLPAVARGDKVYIRGKSVGRSFETVKRREKVRYENGYVIGFVRTINSMDGEIYYILSYYRNGTGDFYLRKDFLVMDELVELPDELFEL